MAATRLLLDGLVTNSRKCCTQYECVTFDEELYPFRGRCPIVRTPTHSIYAYSKPTKYGLKFWMPADAQSYYVSYVQYLRTRGRTRQLIAEDAV